MTGGTSCRGGFVMPCCCLRLNLIHSSHRSRRTTKSQLLWSIRHWGGKALPLVDTSSRFYFVTRQHNGETAKKKTYREVGDRSPIVRMVKFVTSKPSVGRVCAFFTFTPNFYFYRSSHQTFFSLFERSEFLIATCDKKKTDRLCGCVCVDARLISWF